MITKPLDSYVAIDPMALILNDEVYQKLVELRHPHVPKIAEFKQLLEVLTPAERTKAVSHAKEMIEYYDAFIETASKHE